MRTVLVLVLLSPVLSHQRRTVFSCEGSSLSLSCEAGTVIRIIRANFGRFSPSVCPSNTKDTAWSTRCIQPTSLRVASSLCQGEKSCSIPVSVSQFGDPCPDTPKYLELVYTCEREEDNTKKIPDLPPWLINMEYITNTIINKHATVKPTTSTPEPSTPQTSSKTPILKSRDYIRRPSPEFLLYIKQVEEKKMKRRIQAMHRNQENNDKTEGLEEENTVILAIIMASIGCIFIIILSIVK